MKIMMISDTHGSLLNFYQAYETEKPIDLIMHMGDICGQENELQSMVDCPCRIVTGNCDVFSFTDLRDSADFVIDGIKITMRHGNWPYMFTDKMLEYAKANGVRVVASGHTHIPEIDETDGIWFVNPGSISKPRQPGRKPSYIIMTTDGTQAGEPSFEIKYI